MATLPVNLPIFDPLFSLLEISDLTIFLSLLGDNIYATAKIRKQH
jgi:hypothetical protein